MINDLHQNYFNKNIMIDQKIIQQLILSAGQNGKRLQLDLFAKYLKNKVFQDCPLNEIMNHLKLIDLDNDNVVSGIEIDNFLQKYKYKKNNLDVKYRYKHFKSNSMSQKNDLYPHRNIKEKEIHSVLKDLRQTMNQKGLKYIDLF